MDAFLPSISVCKDTKKTETINFFIIFEETICFVALWRLG